MDFPTGEIISDTTGTHHRPPISKMNAVKLNVGGRRFEVPRETLCRSAYFSAMLNGGWRESITSEEIFINRDGDAFRDVLNLLRDPTYPVPRSPQLAIELDYFGVDLKPPAIVAPQPERRAREWTPDQRPSTDEERLQFIQKLRRMSDQRAIDGIERYFERLDERPVPYPVMPTPHLTHVRRCRPLPSSAPGESTFLLPREVDLVLGAVRLEFRAFDVERERSLRLKDLLRSNLLPRLIVRIASRWGDRELDSVDGGMVDRHLRLCDRWDLTNVLADKSSDTLLNVVRRENAHLIRVPLPLSRVFGSTLGVQGDRLLTVRWGSDLPFRLRDLELRCEAESSETHERKSAQATEVSVQRWSTWNFGSQGEPIDFETSNDHEVATVELPLANRLQQLVWRVSRNDRPVRILGARLVAHPKDSPDDPADRFQVFAMGEVDLLEHMNNNLYHPKEPVYCFNCANSGVNFSLAARTTFEVRLDRFPDEERGAVAICVDALSLEFCALPPKVGQGRTAKEEKVCE